MALLVQNLINDTERRHWRVSAVAVVVACVAAGAAVLALVSQVSAEVITTPGSDLVTSDRSLEEAFAALEANDGDQAITLMTFILDRYGSELTDRQRADLYYNRAYALQLAGDFDAAINDYGQSLVFVADDPDVLFNRAVAHAALGDRSTALHDYTSAIAVAPDRAHLFYNRGNLLFDLGRYGLALADYDRVLELDSGHADARANRGRLYAELGAVDMAIADYRAALILAPDLVDVASQLAIVERLRASAGLPDPHRAPTKHAVAGLGAFDEFEWRYPGEVAPAQGGLTISAVSTMIVSAGDIAYAMRQTSNISLRSVVSNLTETAALNPDQSLCDWRLLNFGAINCQ